MPASVLFSVLPDEARRLGLDYFDMFIGGWGGNNTIFADSTGLTYPILPGSVGLPSVAGIAIHPQSDIDRVLVEVSVGPSNPQGTGDVAVRTILPRVIELSIDTPFIFSAPSVGDLLAGSVKSLKLHAHPDTVWASTYTKAGVSSVDGTATRPNTFGSELTRVTPILALRFYLRPRIGGPQGRSPVNHPIDRTGIGGNAVTAPPLSGSGASPPIGEALFAVIPVHGRKNVTASFRLTTPVPNVGALADVRIAVLDMGCIGLNNDDVINAGFERTITTLVGVSTTVSKAITFPPNADWLLLYYTQTAGSNDGRLTFDVRESDDFSSGAAVAI